MFSSLDYLVSRVVVPGFEISEEVYEGSQLLAPHSHRLPHLVVVFEGEIHEEAEGSVRTLDRSQIIYFPGGVNHALTFGSRSLLISIETLEERKETVLELFRNVKRFTSIPGGELLPLTTRIRDEIRRGGTKAKIALEGLALELMAYAARQMEGQGAMRVPPVARDARDVIDRMYNSRIGLSDVARELGVSPVRLAESFRRGYACTVGDYIRRKRVQHVVEKLVNTTESLGDIALEAGFCDQPHMVRVFKTLTGMTPARYRKAHNGLSG